MLLGMCTGFTAFAQDPYIVKDGVIVSPYSLSVGTYTSVTIGFGNASTSSSIPQSANATYTINVPPVVGVTSASITVPSGTTANLTLTLGSYTASKGTTVIVNSNKGDVPINTTYTLVMSLRGVIANEPGVESNVIANAVASGLSTNNSSNDNGNSALKVFAGPIQPVSLVSFTAKPQEDQTIALAWTTSWETNNKGFLIERSKDLKTFQTVGEVTEIGASSESLKNYRLTDFTPFRGTSYYRLTQLDLDGKSTILKVESVVLRDGAYGVFPNPVVSNQPFRVSLDEPTTAQLNFYSSDGHVVSLQQSGVQGDTVLLKADSKLSTGVYVLTVEERGQIRKHRIVIE